MSQEIITNSQRARPILSIGNAFMSLAEIGRVVDELPMLQLDEQVAAQIASGANFVERKIKEDQYIYGVNTGFGSLCETRVSVDDLSALQYNHVVSHACGVGEPALERVSRLTLFIKLLTFRSGHTGISLTPVERLMQMWNDDVIPVIPKKGTVGASGDLAPLAHLSLPLLGLGSVYFRGRITSTQEVLRELGWPVLRLQPKEGLALTNGVQYINAIAVDCLLTLGRLIRCADVIAALSIQAFSAAQTFYHPAYHETSYHKERRDVADNLVHLLSNSNHHALPTCNLSKQDPYSFRCIPQVHGAVRQAFQFGWSTVEREVNGVSDNPLFFPSQDLILFGGNLHGESTAMALDFLAIAASELASISERRTYQLLSGQRGLPSFLIGTPGLHSGLMIPQYTAAALVNQNKVLCTPASVDTIPTCQLQEDHVSMGGTSAYKLCEILSNCEYILAIELLTAAQAIDLNQGLLLSPITAEIFKSFREQIPFLDQDRVLSQDIERARDFLNGQSRRWHGELGLR